MELFERIFYFLLESYSSSSASLSFLAWILAISMCWLLVSGAYECLIRLENVIISPVIYHTSLFAIGGIVSSRKVELFPCLSNVIMIDSLQIFCTYVLQKCEVLAKPYGAFTLSYFNFQECWRSSKCMWNPLTWQMVIYKPQTLKKFS